MSARRIYCFRCPLVYLHQFGIEKDLSEKECCRCLARHGKVFPKFGEDLVRCSRIYFSFGERSKLKCSLCRT
jgi:hypothetical protein